MILPLSCIMEPLTVLEMNHKRFLSPFEKHTGFLLPLQNTDKSCFCISWSKNVRKVSLSNSLRKQLDPKDIFVLYVEPFYVSQYELFSQRCLFRSTASSPHIVFSIACKRDPIYIVNIIGWNSDHRYLAV